MCIRDRGKYKLERDLKKCWDLLETKKNVAAQKLIKDLEKIMTSLPRDLAKVQSYTKFFGERQTEMDLANALINILQNEPESLNKALKTLNTMKTYSDRFTPELKLRYHTVLQYVNPDTDDLEKKIGKTLSLSNT
eukprot:TRINITY_DN5743_c0_g1_i1.p1 TRINITY_DN5743_c0_g1~~TRINITY_DN5743_c0_g1_i1.p1  ORF type:complete len:135 (+),score=30.89 TRINITY_DN5743_c0_g1_i1:64-468(+)